MSRIDCGECCSAPATCRCGTEGEEPVFQPHERGLITLLTAVLPRWGDALLLVKPETVLRWHRKGVRLLWRRKSEPTKPLAPRVSPDIVELISATVGSAS